ncbi:MAG: hypothetical protein ACYCSP_09785 [Acidobacteriaceae bacterium]
MVPAQRFSPVSVPFDYFNRHIFITVTLNGTPGMVFPLDSGTNSNILSMRTSAAADLGNKPSLEMTNPFTTRLPHSLLWSLPCPTFWWSRADRDRYDDG